jgi:hypothetical protein
MVVTARLPAGFEAKVLNADALPSGARCEARNHPICGPY